MFSNTSIKAPRKPKPHICVREGRWRVSPMGKPYHKTGKLFNDAHSFIRILNIDQGRTYGT